MTRSLRKVSAWLDGESPSSASTWGWRCFQLGLFLLPSSALLAGLLLFPALILGSLGRERPFWCDPWNAPLLLAGLFMVVGCVRSYSGPLAWVGLGNWIPFFWGFWGFQPYVTLPSSRRRSCLWRLAGRW